MRIGDYEKRQIKRQILQDLYGKKESELDETKKEIAGKNYSLHYQDYKSYIDNIPESWMNTPYSVSTQINFNMEADERDRLCEKWAWPLSNNFNGGTPSDIAPKDNLDLKPELYEEAARLIEEIIEIRNEKKDLADFLAKTLQDNSGYKQLMAAWPPSLHKYIPKPTKRAAPKKKAKKEDKPSIAAPSTLQTRLATNLLEGD